MISWLKSPQKVGFEKILLRVFFCNIYESKAVHKLYLNPRFKIPILRRGAEGGVVTNLSNNALNVCFRL